MKRRALLIAAILVLAPQACQAQKVQGADTQPPICAPSADDAAIYWATFEKAILKNVDDKRQIVG